MNRLQMKKWIDLACLAGLLSACSTQAYVAAIAEKNE